MRWIRRAMRLNRERILNLNDRLHFALFLHHHIVKKTNAELEIKQNWVCFCLKEWVESISKLFLTKLLEEHILICTDRLALLCWKKTFLKILERNENIKTYQEFKSTSFFSSWNLLATVESQQLSAFWASPPLQLSPPPPLLHDSSHLRPSKPSGSL